MFRRLSFLAGIAVSQLVVALAVFGLLSRQPAAADLGGPVVTPCTGDVNGDCLTNIADPIYLLQHLFSGGPAPLCCADGPALSSSQIQFLCDLLPHMSIEQLPDGQGGIIETVRFSGVNVQIVNGTGATATANGTGNLIIGYNENNVGLFDRSGSHNAAVGGPDLEYTMWGGLVTGERCAILGASAVALGGFNNTASGTYSSVCGGSNNNAMGESTSVTGGQNNEASGVGASVSGGLSNQATGDFSSVTGGTSNVASGVGSSVAGGEQNKAIGERSSVVGGGSSNASDGNQAVGRHSCVSGGATNRAIGVVTSVSGGQDNMAVSDVSSILGGRQNVCGPDTIDNDNATISGGNGNRASGFCSTVCGGGGPTQPADGNQATGPWSSVSGGRGRTASGPSDWVAGSLFQDQ